MSLQYWFPLTEDLHNQGAAALSNINVTAATTIATNGKLGNCYTNTGTTANIANAATFSAEKFSACAWVRINTSRTNWCRAFGMAGTGTYFGFGCEHSNGTLLGFHFYKTIDGTNTAIFDDYPVTKQIGVWVHYTMTYDGIHAYFYENGTLIKTYNVASARQNTKCEMTTLYLFGGTSGNYSQCSLNDVRIYDHCLSAEEVREIANGLILHYKLDCGIWGNKNILRNSSGHLGTVEDSWSGNITTGFMNNESILIVQKTETTGALTTSCAQGKQPNNIDNNIAPADWTTGDEYTISGQYYIPSSESQEGNDPEIEIQWRCVDEDDGKPKYKTHTIDISREIKDQWIKFEETFQVPFESSAIDRTMRFSLARLPGSCLTTIYFKRIKLEKGPVATLWCPADSEMLINRDTIIDESGYHHHGTILNTISFSDDTPRYNTSINLISGNSAINCGRGGMVTDSITVNFWLKSSGWANPVSCTEGGGWNFESSGNYFRFPVYISGVGYKYGASTTTKAALCNNQWHMLTGVYDRLNGHIKIYVDGKLDNDYDAGTTNVIGYNGSNVIWIGAEASASATAIGSNGMVGLFSDFRIYCTALPISEIIKIYNSSMIFDNIGGIHTYSFEDDEVSDITLSKTGIVSSPVILEENNINNSNIQIGKISYPFLWADNITVTSTNTGHIINYPDSDRYTIIKNINEFRSYSGKTFRLSYDISVPGTRKSTENNTTGSSVYYGVDLIGTYAGTSGSPSSPRYCTSQLSYSGENARIIQTMTLPKLNNAFIYATLRLELRTSDQPASTNNNTWSISNIRVEVIDDNLSQPWINGIELIEK